MLHTNVHLFNIKTRRLIQNGASIFEVPKLPGHSDIRVTKIFFHLRADDLLYSMKRLNTYCIETFALFAFGAEWIVAGKYIPLLVDKEDKFVCSGSRMLGLITHQSTPKEGIGGLNN